MTLKGWRSSIGIVALFGLSVGLGFGPDLDLGFDLDVRENPRLDAPFELEFEAISESESASASVEAWLPPSASGERLAVDPSVRDRSSNTPEGLEPNPWRWRAPRTAGPWGLEAMRVPQLWNLNDLAARRRAVIGTGVLDAGFQDDDRDGFNDHPDLTHVQTLVFDPESGRLEPGAVKGAHGQHVVGILGATVGNGLGIDGLNPFARVVAVSPQIPRDRRGLEAAWEVVLAALERLLEEHPEVRVVNLSLAYNWAINGRLKIDPNVDRGAQGLAERQGLRVRELAARFPDVLFVAAAGNDSRNRYGFPYEIQAKWASPFGWAALGPTVDGWAPAPNVLIIEAVDDVLPGERQHRKSDFSNVGGHLSAPGGRILSTVLNGRYDTYDGTSMAAPHVTGLIGYLWALEPSLTVEELKALLFRTARPVLPEVGGRTGPEGEEPAPLVDAFAAALAIDLIRGDEAVQRALVDVDDCTPDGNLRVDPLGRVVEGFCPDGRRGDGAVDMADFRAFRDALLALEGRGALDGPPDHPKRDLNGDGCVHGAQPGCPYPERVYPRFDFNGDGVLDRKAKAPFKGRALTDLEVLMEVWGAGPGADTEGWRAEALPGLLDSVDLHLDLTELFEREGVERVEVRATGAPAREATAERPRLVITTPLQPRVRVHVRGFSAEGALRVERCAVVEPTAPGQDLWVALKACSGPGLTGAP